MSSNPVGTDWLRKQTKQIGDQATLPMDEATASATQIEAWLQRRNVRYAPARPIPLSMIDTKRSRDNQARKDPIVAESVDRFVASMKQGAVFPPVVLYQVGAKLVLVDGNNRHEAAIRAKVADSISGIIIDERTDSDLIQLLTVEANTSHGVTPGIEWRIVQAFHLCALGHDDEAAANATGISVATLRASRSAKEAEERAKALRIHGFSELSAGAKQLLNALKLEQVFYAAAKLAADLKLTAEQVRTLQRAVKLGKSEADQLSAVAEQHRLLIAESAAKKAMATRRVNSPKNSLVAGIGLVTAVNVDALVAQILTVSDRDEVKKRIRKLEDQLLAIQVAMEKLETMDE